MNNKRLFLWFIEVAFILALIFFSGHVSAFSTTKTEPTRIELHEKSRASSKRTISLETTCRRLAHPSQTKNFEWYLTQYRSFINVQLRNNIRQLPDKKMRVKSMTAYYSNDHSDAERG